MTRAVARGCAPGNSIDTMSSSSANCAARAMTAPLSSTTMLPPSKTSSSWPLIWFTYATAHELSLARSAIIATRSCRRPRWNGDALMLTASVAPALAWAATGPTGLQMSSQIVTPTSAPPMR